MAEEKDVERQNNTAKKTKTTKTRSAKTQIQKKNTKQKTKPRAERKKRTSNFPVNKIMDFFELSSALGEFYPESAWERFIYYFSLKKDFSPSKDKIKFKDFIEMMIKNNLAYTNNDYITVKTNADYKILTKQSVDKRNFYIIRINSSFWNNFEKMGLLAFENSQLLFSKIKSDDECIFIDEKNCIYGFGILEGESIFCNTRLIKNKIIPYQIKARLKKFEYSPYIGENILKNDIEEIKRSDFFSLISYAIEKQLENELFSKKKLNMIYEELEKLLGEKRFFYHKMEEILGEIANFYNLNMNSRREKSWNYVSMEFLGHNILKIGYSCDLITYFNENVRPNLKFKVMVLGKKEEKTNLISLERVWYIFKHITELKAEKRYLFN